MREARVEERASTLPVNERFARRRAAVAGPILALSLLANALSPGTARAAASWYDGPIQYSTITNCWSIIQSLPYQEFGTGAYVGFLADPKVAQPAPNSTYYVHVVLAGMGNPCSGTRSYVDVALPANTSLAIGAGAPVYCFYDGTPMGPADGCPQVLPASTMNPGAFVVPSTDAAHANLWPLAQGHTIEFQIPVRSTAPLTNSALRANVWTIDGNSSPWLHPQQGVYVFSSQPTILYPSPSTTAVTSTTGRSLAYLYSYDATGTAFFDLGTTASYGLFHDSGPITSGTAWDVSEHWGVETPALHPDTLYHWRLGFTTGGTTYYGEDQTFRTLPDGRVTVGTGAAASCTEASLTNALATAKEIVFDCGALPATINLTAARTVTSNLIINGGNKVTLDAGGANRHFQVQSPAHLTLNGIVLANGMSGAGCGGAINVASGAQLTLNEVRLLNNHSTSDGGALCNAGSAAIAATLFKDNISGGHGGAIRSSSQITIADSRFDGNQAGGNGGGIDLGGTASVATSSFVGNQASYRGGGINTYYGTLTLTDSSFSQNSANIYGGALASDASTSLVTNTTFSGNTTPNVGGALERGGTGTLTLVNSTIAGNTAGVQGGNLYAGGAPDLNILLKNTIVTGGTPNNCDFPVASQGNNLESANSCGLGFAGDLANLDPQLGPLQDNGGPTMTYALLAGSPAIDAGTDSGCPAKDQRGVARPLDGNGDGVSRCDIGALELVAPVEPVTPVTPVTPVAPPAVTLSDALEQPRTWLTSAAAPWIGQTADAHDGVDATQAGAVGDRQASWIRTTVRGPATVSFWWKSSSEIGDKLAFFVGRTLKASRSGTGGWQKRSFTIGGGRQVLKWVFKRNAALSGGLNTGFLDQVRIRRR